MPRDIRPRRVGSSTIGETVTFAAGPFAGHTIRAELEEIQKADLGRKYACKDRRPLDPPPVVRLRIIHVKNPGTPDERERDFGRYDELVAFGLTCHLDLFPVRGDDGSESLPWENMGHHRASSSEPPPSLPPVFATAQALPVSPVEQYHVSYSYTVPPPLPPLHVSPPGMPALHSTLRRLPPAGPHPAYIHHDPVAESPAMPGSSEVVAYFNDYAITEGSSCTRWLVGTRFTEAAVIDYQDETMLVFVFPELAVQLEGVFVLRYRVFNIFARTAGEQCIPVIAECYGGPFRVYSTKEFPGLRASTELTKHLSSLGIRTHIREHERKRRKIDRSPVKSGPTIKSVPAAKSSPMKMGSAAKSGRVASKNTRAAAASAQRVTRARPARGRRGGHSKGKGKGKACEDDEEDLESISHEGSDSDWNW
ncbi:hypothetical protein CERSUDRAFT_114167 [Gelatoporia subvermispora B]|uniref:Velvet domain-containing protein n=1 Tax=Ceriporiopsis subvermispora (strain B) TaxID=914234 RepID=M2RGF5_CERS8|nr:hypothetical protein CERSUDRAFT_114167 [Gelatoporia subvermispora B]